MQVKCRFCNRPFALSKEDVHIALEGIHTNNLKYHNADCPHCGKQNRMTRADLQRASPGWTYQPGEVEQEEN